MSAQATVDTCVGGDVQRQVSEPDLQNQTCTAGISNGGTLGATSDSFSSVLKIEEATLIPPQAQAFQPTPEEILKPTPNGEHVRLIFGNLPLSSFEKGEVAKLKRRLGNKTSIFQNTVFADDHFVVRFLQGNDWNADKCIEDMERHLVWRKTHLPVPVHLVAPHLRKGYCYIFGRDKRFRPIVVIRCKEFINAEPEDVVRVLLFWLELAIHKLLILNRVEQWRVIIDLDQCSALRAPVGILRDIADNLMRNYRGRLAQMLVVNSGFFFWSIWQIVSVVLPERTKQKISLYTSNYQADLLSHVNKNQVEERYGGTCVNVTEFDAIRMPSGPYT